VTALTRAPALAASLSRQALAALCVLQAAFALACARNAAPPDPNIITVAVRVGPNSLDPLRANDEGTARVGELVFESLMDIGDDLRAAPALAVRVDNPDPLTFVAHLHRGVKFHDGHELTARDVVYTFSRFLDPDFLSPYKGGFEVMASVEAIDDYTVAFRLKEPFPSFPLANLVPVQIVPADAGDAMATAPVGTGPYRFVRYDVDDKVVLAAFEEYRGGPPSNAGVILKIVPDDTMRGLELRKGNSDLVINQMPPDIVHQLEASGGFTVARERGLDFSYLGFNLRDPILVDRRVRHAIGYAIDRDAIIRYMRRNLATPASGLIPPQSWAYEPEIFTFTHDPERARELLDSAGYTDPDGDGPLPRLRLTLKISTNEEIVLQSIVIQQDLARVGIELEIRTYEFATMFADILKGNFQVMSLQWVGGAVVDPDILRRVFHSTQAPPAGFNRGYYSNPEVDRLLDLATQTLAEAERKEYYSAAQKIIAEDAPYIPIWNRTNVVIAQPTLAGLAVGPTGDYQGLRSVQRIPARVAAR
jgi:peptide/nickel transport system substrate-binding protein